MSPNQWMRGIFVNYVLFANYFIYSETSADLMQAIEVHLPVHTNFFMQVTNEEKKG